MTLRGGRTVALDLPPHGRSHKTAKTWNDEKVSAAKKKDIRNVEQSTAAVARENSFENDRRFDNQDEKDMHELVRLRSAFRARLVDSLTRAGKAEIVGARTSGSNGLYLTLDIDGTAITIETTGVEVIEGDLGEVSSHLKGMRGRLNRVKNPEFLSIQELRERNLPMYWNEEWLRAELTRLGSYAEIARVHNFPSSVTIASYAKRKFGIDIQGKYAQKRDAVYADYDNNDYTQSELAERHDVAVATVYRWLKERDDGKITQARRGSKRQRDSE